MKFAGKEFQKNQFGRRNQEMRGAENVVLALLIQGQVLSEVENYD